MPLPADRWQGIWFPRVGDNQPFMQAMIDGLEPTLRGYTAYPTNDFENIDATLLPILAWQNGAVAYDPEAAESAQRNVLADARRVATLVGTDEVFSILMENNQTVGTLYYVGDYDSAGQPVARTSELPLRMQGTHSRHTVSPTVEDTTRDAQGRPTSTPNPAFVWDNTTYHKFVRVEMILPADREDTPAFVRRMSEAIRQVIPYTLELVELTVLRPIIATAYIGAHLQPHIVWRDIT